MKKPKKFDLFCDPMAEYLKPTSIELRLNGGNEFETLELVLGELFKTLGFKLVDTDEDDGFLNLKFEPKRGA